jgi:hypothetical protein
LSHPFWHNFVHAICLTIAATDQQRCTRTWHKKFGRFRYTPRTLRSSSPAACEWPSRMASHRRFLKSQLGSWQQAFVKPRPQPHLHRGVHHGHHGCQPQQARSSTQFCVHLRPFSRSCHAAVPSRLSFRSYPVSPSNPNFPNAAESETLLGEPKPIVVFTCPRN